MLEIDVAIKLTLTPEVEWDIDEAYQWYDDRRPGLGEEFLSCVDACIQRISRRPESYPEFHQGYRRMLVRRFPYAIFYEYSTNSVIVYGIFHTAQDPEKMAAKAAVLVLCYSLIWDSPDRYARVMP